MINITGYIDKAVQYANEALMLLILMVISFIALVIMCVLIEIKLELDRSRRCCCDKKSIDYVSLGFEVCHQYVPC